jgi:ABC-type transporter Mla maintaining outer membrane lipid asymmetry ATPase subunit MlaF
MTAYPVALRGLGRAFGDRPVLRDVALDVAPGEVVALLGASG